MDMKPYTHQASILVKDNEVISRNGREIEGEELEHGVEN